MSLTREERKLLHQKSKQPTFGSGKPDNKQGNEGDISFRQVEGSGTVEYVKTNGEWVAVASSGEMPTVRMIGSSRGGSSSTSGTGTISGSYVATITGGDGIDSTGSTSGSNINHTLSFDLNGLATTETAIVDADFIAMYDTDGSHSAKITFEDFEDAIFSSVSGDITITESGVAAIASDVIVNADVKTDAAIVVSKLALTAGDGLTLNTNDMDLDAGLTTVTSIKNNSLIIGGNSQNNTIDFGTDDVILFDTDNTERMRVDAAGVDVTGALTTTTTAGIGTNATFGTSAAAGNMSDLLEPAQETALADALDGSNNSFDFATGTTNLVVANGFTASNATFTNSSGIGLLTNSSSAQGYVSLPLTTISGKIYECTFDVISHTSDLEVCLSSSTSWNTAAESGIRSANTGHSLIHNYVADDTSTYLIIRLASSTSGHAGRIDNIVVRQAVFFSDGEIESGSGFVSGFAGSGWKIDKDATATNEYDLTVDNMFIRGRLSVYELLIQQIRATNGAVFVTSAAKVLSTSSLSATDSGGDITFEDPSGHGICPFAANDLIMMQRVVPGSLVAGSSSAGSTDVIKKLVYKVSSVSGATATVIAATGFTNNDFPVKGDDFVRIGSTSDTDRQGLLYLTSDDSNAPFMDIKDGVDSYANWHAADTTKVRVGKLSGITDSGLNAGSALTGYGLYGGNVFLKGEITAKSGLIGCNSEGNHGWKIEESKIYNNGEIQYIDFDGTGDGLNFGTQATDGPLAISSSTGISIAFWINFPTLGTTEQIFASHDNNSHYIGWWIQKTSTANKIQFNWGDGTGTGSGDRESRLSDEVLAADTWYFVVITSTFHATTIGETNIYVNNHATTISEPSGTGGISTPAYPSTGLSRFAKEITGGADTEGEYKMKNFAVWNTRLDLVNTNPVTAIYNSGSYLFLGDNSGNYTQSSSLKLHCDFTTGSTNDLSANHSSPSLEGGAAIVNPYNNNFIGLVQASTSSITETDSDGANIPISSFFAGATTNTGANAAISFGSDGKIRGNGIYRKNAVDYLITASRIFGNGSDGDVTLSGTTTLSRDMYYDNLTINASITVNTAGYRIFVRNTLDISAGSGVVMRNNGSDGGNGTAPTNETNGGDGAVGTAGPASATGSLLGGPAGGVGGLGNTGQTQSVAAGAGGAGGINNITNCVRTYTASNGARGGTGSLDGGSAGSATATSTAGVSGGSAGTNLISITNADLTFIIAMRDFFSTGSGAPALYPATGAAGGGGGSGGGYVITGGPTYNQGGHGGFGGGGGGSGGHVMLLARIISGTQSNLTIQANGGDGGDGTSNYTTGSGGAGGIGSGGNGGDGGCVTIISGTDPDGITIQVTKVTKGGQGSTGTTTDSTSASDGTDGVSIIIHC